MTEFLASSDGMRIAYEVAGEGIPIMLVHGFASDRVQNWKAPGWYDTLLHAGYRVIALDCRGHGESSKPHDPAYYGQDKMGADVIAVMRAAAAPRAHVMGYSMGGMITIHLLVQHETAIDKAVIGGVGETYLAPEGSTEARMTSPETRARIAAALIEPDESKIVDPVALGFRRFAGQPGKDRMALAACMSADRPTYRRDALARVEQPVLVVCGEKDDRTGGAEGLAGAFRGGRGVTVPRRDHMTTVGDRVYKDAVLEFLAG